MPILIDTHAHLDDGRFEKDLEEVLARARETSLERILTIGVDLATSQAAVELAAKHDLIRAVIGIQPNHVAEANEGDWDAILALVQSARPVALGETGLDRYWDKAPFDLQEDYFRRHLDLAREWSLPVVIHCREAEADVVRVLTDEFRQRGPISGVMHSYSGDADSARACLDMGLHISFAGMVTFKNNHALREIARAVPIDRILVETDAPYLTPEPFRGRRNEPARVVHTAECLAGVHGMTLDEFAEATTQNARTLFRL